MISELKAANDFRPSLDDVRRFLSSDKSPRAIFLNSPHNPTGGVATLEDLKGLADLVRGKDVAVFSDEPYDRMVWRGRHHSLLELPGMIEQTVAAYTFSKSFSMSGWRLGFAVSSPEIIDVLGKLTNSAISCVPPFTQMAGVVAMRDELAYRDAEMKDVPEEGRAAGRRHEQDRRRLVPHARRNVLRLSVGGGRLQPPRHHVARPGAVSCSKAPTTSGAWRAWAASASERPDAGSSASAARSRTSASPRRSRSWPRRSNGRIAWMPTLRSIPSID